MPKPEGYHRFGFLVTAPYRHRAKFRSQAENDGHPSRNRRSPILWRRRRMGDVLESDLSTIGGLKF
jgi:hypothetical protein